MPKIPQTKNRMMTRYPALMKLRSGVASMEMPPRIIRTPIITIMVNDVIVVPPKLC